MSTRVASNYTVFESVLIKTKKKKNLLTLFVLVNTCGTLAVLVIFCCIYCKQVETRIADPAAALTEHIKFRTAAATVSS